MATEQATGAGRCGASAKADNTLCGHFFPARRVAFWRTTAGVAAIAKASSLGCKPRLVGLPPQNAMTTAWG